ncbi:MAG: NAD(+)/NADH kinase [Anaerolineales bacterium]|jgi:NAD+ kinase
MSSQALCFQNIAVAANPQVKEAANEAEKIATHLNELGIRNYHGLLYDESLRKRVNNGEFDLLIALGGDGTMLRAGHLCGPSNVPILGINLGRFGFLTEVKRDEWLQVMPRLLSGDCWVEKRMMLTAEQWRDERVLDSWEVLNETVISRGKVVRPLHFYAYVDGRLLTTYVADALIAATPTGSTAYALAAGGPILPPELRNILLVPVAPHMSFDRAIVLAEGSTVSITAEADHPAMLSLDGQMPIQLANKDRVDVHASNHSVQFVRFQDPGYFYRNLTQHMNKNSSTGNHR